MKRILGLLAAVSLAAVATTASAQYRPPGALPPQQAGSGAQAQKPVVKVCTGKQDGVYFYASQMMAKFGQSFLVQPILTQGSLENTQRITDGSCDVAFAQNDAIRVYKDLDARANANIDRGMPLYKEYVHLLCNRESGITKLSHLRKGHVVAIGSDGSGSQVVWEALKKIDKSYGEIEVSNKEGIRALTAIQDGSEVTCLLYVGGLGNGFLKRDAQKFADKVVLVNINEGVDKEKDAKGRPIYTYEAIPNGTYGKLMPGGMMWGTTQVSTFAVDAVVIANSQWIDRNATLYDTVLRSITNAIPAIREKASK